MYSIKNAAIRQVFTGLLFYTNKPEAFDFFFFNLKAVLGFFWFFVFSMKPPVCGLQRAAMFTAGQDMRFSSPPWCLGPRLGASCCTPLDLQHQASRYHFLSLRFYGISWNKAEMAACQILLVISLPWFGLLTVFCKNHVHSTDTGKPERALPWHFSLF